MNVKCIALASKQFLKTNEGYDAAPSVRGLIRHVEATIQLYEAFVPDGMDSRFSRLAFSLWRLVLVTKCKAAALFQRAARMCWH